jgi:hypothetical protein
MLIFANVLALALIAADEPVVQQSSITGPHLGMPKVPKPITGNEPKSVAEEAWQLSLPDAIRIGLDNSEVIRVISLGHPMTPPGGFEPTPLNVGGVAPGSSSITIARLNCDASIYNFKSAVLAHVRSIEQQYWALSYFQVALWACETAVKQGEEILARERAGLQEGRSTRADVAETEQQLENFKLNLASATSDVITTERQLRNILGLPPADGRRIVTSTAPTEAKLVKNFWNAMSEMNQSQPNIASERQTTGLLELKLAIDGENSTLSADQREALKNQLAKQQESFKQILQQSAHSLARFSLEVESTYNQFQTAQKLREASKQRLEAQQAFSKEGRITIDRLLDAVSQYADAVSQEAQHKASYNTALAAFEEAKGTLLNCHKITIAEGQSPQRAFVQPKDASVAPASFDATLPVLAPPVKPQPAAASTTYKLRAKLGLLKVLDVELEICPGSK